jgi:hypothetical protein
VNERVYITKTVVHVRPAPSCSSVLKSMLMNFNIPNVVSH